MLLITLGLVSIQLVSPASGDRGVAIATLVLKLSFHSISFPSEWGLFIPESIEPLREVSIQLVSPASGDSELNFCSWNDPRVSIQLVSPASGDSLPVP